MEEPKLNEYLKTTSSLTEPSPRIRLYPYPEEVRFYASLDKVTSPRYMSIQSSNGLLGAGALVINLTESIKAKIRDDVRVINSLVTHVPLALREKYFICIVTKSPINCDEIFFHKGEWNQ